LLYSSGPISHSRHTNEDFRLVTNRYFAVADTVEKQTADLRKELSTVQADLTNSLRRRDEAVKNEQIAIDDLKQQVLGIN